MVDDGGVAEGRRWSVSARGDISKQKLGNQPVQDHKLSCVVKLSSQGMAMAVVVEGVGGAGKP